MSDGPNAGVDRLHPADAYKATLGWVAGSLMTGMYTGEIAASVGIALACVAFLAVYTWDYRRSLGGPNDA